MQRSIQTKTSAVPDAHGGNERAGFELAVDKLRRVLRLRMWGLWDLQTAEEFRSAVLKHVRTTERPFAILADTREFMAQSAPVTEIRKDVMQRCLQAGCDRIASLGEHAVHSMQFKRIAAEIHMKAEVFHDEETALAWASERDRESSR